MMDTMAAMNGMVTTRGITVIMHRITRIITGAITRVITLQNIHRQQCEKVFSMDCGERKSYEAYKREIEDYETNQVPNPIRPRTTVESITNQCIARGPAPPHLPRTFNGKTGTVLAA